ncbi:MAG: hypothetical protein ICV77_11105 [Cyanobacteria bacterium Co-bin8]|nr:hypothetical protein [Cyanobacteria bacterium Co-bin8]
MGKNYYPWNIQALVEWLRAEMARDKAVKGAVTGLDISPDTIEDWMVSRSIDITLDQIQAIAHYRRWSIEQTTQWLGIKPAHFKELVS